MTSQAEQISQLRHDIEHLKADYNNLHRTFNLFLELQSKNQSLPKLQQSDGPENDASIESSYYNSSSVPLNSYTTATASSINMPGFNHYELPKETTSVDPTSSVDVMSTKDSRVSLHGGNPKDNNLYYYRRAAI